MARPQHCTTEILAARDKSIDFDTRGGKLLCSLETSQFSR